MAPGNGHTFYYEMSGFFRKVDNYIQTSIAEKEGTMQYTNVPAVHVKGAEGEMRYDWQGRLNSPQTSATRTLATSRSTRVTESPLPPITTVCPTARGYSVA